MKTSHSNALREAKSREDLGIYSEYGIYSEIFDRRNSDGMSESVDRYLKRGMELPSPKWTKEFIQAGGSFDSCGSWGVSPEEGIKIEVLGVPAEFAGKMLKLLGRADYDYSHLVEVYNEGIVPQKRAEFHACVAGIHRQALAQKAKTEPKSTMRLGWMSEDKFVRHICLTSSRVGDATNWWYFNGVTPSEDYLGMNPVFEGWDAKRPSKEDMDVRRSHKNPLRSVGWLEKVPPRLMAVALRQRKEYIDRDKLPTSSNTSVGCIIDCGDGETLIHGGGYYYQDTYKKVSGRKIHVDLSVAKIMGVWFVWNPANGFSNHIENASLKEAVSMWDNRSRRGEPRPICLNDVRNDRTGTAGFCLTGTKSFLQDRMPFVYNLVRIYSIWSEIPNEIMSTKWDVDFKIFKGYPVP